MNNKPYKKFDIPVWLIIVALIINFPIGVILIILRTVSFLFSSNNEFSGNKKNEKVSSNTDNDNIKSFKSKALNSKKGKMSAGEVISTIILVLFVLALADVVFDITIPITLAEIIKTIIYTSGIGVSAFIKKICRGRRTRYIRYKEWIGDADYCNISTLAYAVSESEKKIIKDMERMTDKGMFGPAAYIDSKRMMFFRHPKAAEQYETLKKTEKYTMSLYDDKKVEDKVEHDEYREIILKIRRLNDEIQDISVSDRIYNIEEQTQNIFDYIKEHPDKKNSIRTFMNYYLPTTLKLLESYAKIEHVGVAGENMQKSKENIEKILDMLVFGFVQQVDQLYASEYIDISSDIEVLETMMKKDGLTNDKDFNVKSFGASAAEAKENKEN